MVRSRRRLINTNLENLNANLRGEVGEVITTWLILRRYVVAAQALEPKIEPTKELENRELGFLRLMSDKLRDELVGRLSELSEKKIGRLTFYFTAQKIDALHSEVEAFTRFAVKNRLREKRNQDISHKELPENFSDRRDIHIDYRVLTRAVAMALRLMKKIDRKTLGPAAPYLWREARTRRYQFMSPPRVGYLLVPYLNLSEGDRIKVVLEELAEGADVWSPMETSVDGRQVVVMANKRWGVLNLGTHFLALARYPLVNIQSLSVEGSSPKDSNPEPV